MAFNPISFHRFGGKRALLSTLRHSGAALAGRFSAYQVLDWPVVTRLVFVCKGNICRSAFAAEKARMLGRRATSAGLEADPGKPADERAQRAARRRQVDLSQHRSQTIPGLAPQAGDLLIAFEPEQAQRLVAATATQRGVQVTLLGLWHRQPWWAYLHDPYGHPDHYFDRCFDRIEQSLDGLLGGWDAAVAAVHTVSTASSAKRGN
jgi:protein-tyrosine phosphatase